MLNSYRVGPTQCGSRERLDGLVRWLERHRAACDEVSLLTAKLHGCEALNDRRAQLKPIHRAMAALRAGGFRVSINVLNMLGHPDEALDRMAKPALQVMVGHDVTERRQSVCHADPDGIVPGLDPIEPWGLRIIGQHPR